MNKEALHTLLKDTSQLSELTLPELKELVEDFPFFHAARLLYLKNLAQVGDIRFSHLLKEMSVSIPDRRKLFLLIEGDRYQVPILHVTEEVTPADDTRFALIDDFLTQTEGEEKSENESSLLFEPSVSSDYIFWSLTKEQEPDEESNVAPLQHQALIDSFIQQEENRERGSLLEMEENMKPEDSLTPESSQEKDDAYLKLLDDSYFTETLARIYVKQHRYDKALEIIKNLRLKYPEKNLYFADQIRFLEKLIINTKK